MALEFKKLSDVAVVETVSETANVLIEEDGVIKKVAKDEMGGVKVASSATVGQTIVVKAVDEAGNPTEWECVDMDSYDVIIDWTMDENNNSVFSYAHGSYDVIKAKLDEEKIPKIFIKSSITDENGTGKLYARDLAIHYTKTASEESITVMMFDFDLKLNPDGTIVMRQ